MEQKKILNHNLENVTDARNCFWDFHRLTRWRRTYISEAPAASIIRISTLMADTARKYHSSDHKQVDRISRVYIRFTSYFLVDASGLYYFHIHCRENVRS
jgi:hypothetical protein